MEYLGVIMPELLEDLDEMEKLIKNLNKLRDRASIVAFLIPDNTYETLKAMLYKREFEIEEYSTRKWLTGIIPQPDKFYLSKIHILMNRGDIFKVSEILPECKKDIYTNIDCFKKERMILIGNNHSAENLFKKNIRHSIKKIKGIKNLILIKLISEK